MPAAPRPGPCCGPGRRRPCRRATPWPRPGRGRPPTSASMRRGPTPSRPGTPASCRPAARHRARSQGRARPVPRPAAAERLSARCLVVGDDQRQLRAVGVVVPLGHEPRDVEQSRVQVPGAQRRHGVLRYERHRTAGALLGERDVLAPGAGPYRDHGHRAVGADPGGDLVARDERHLHHRPRPGRRGRAGRGRPGGRCGRRTDQQCAQHDGGRRACRTYASHTCPLNRVAPRERPPVSRGRTLRTRAPVFSMSRQARRSGPGAGRSPGVRKKCSERSGGS